MNWIGRYFSQKAEDGRGFAIVAVVLTLALVTILATMGIKTSINEQRISTNDELYKMSFYSAEAARAHVVYNIDLYGSKNIQSGSPVSFSYNSADSATQIIVSTSHQAYDGQVEYLSAMSPPRGSGYQVGKFKTHVYKMTCNGYGPRNAKAQIEAGFYRIGF